MAERPSLLSRILGRGAPGAGPEARAARSVDDAALFDDEFQRRLEALALVARKTYEGRARAERRSKKTGAGVEFADHREYAPGDDFRFLDWNLYGRTDRLLVKLFQEEEDLSVHVLLDVSRSMTAGTPPKLAYGKRLAAALSYVGLSGLDRVSVTTFSDRVVERLAPVRGRARILRVLDFLRRQGPDDGGTSLGKAMRAFVARGERRGLVLLVSDLYDPEGFEEGLDVLRWARFEPTVVHLWDEGEASPPLHGDVTLVDRETGRAREVTVTPAVLARYRAAHERYRARIAAFCAEKQVGHASIATSQMWDDAVLAVLRRSSVVR